MLKTCIAMAAVVAMALPAVAGNPADSKAVRSEDGKYYDKDDNPTYNIKPDGTVDWFTYSGFRQYHSECHVCHGPEGLGSTYAPALVDSLKTMSYTDFLEVVTNGKQEVNTSVQKVMPAFGLNKNVMCYADDLYIYLRARADGALERGGRPKKRDDKPKAVGDAVNACLSG